MRAFTLPTPEPVNAALFGGTSRKMHFQMFDTPTELAAFARSHRKNYVKIRGGVDVNGAHQAFFGNRTFEQGVNIFERGDMSGVAASDALMQRYEGAEIMTARRAWRDDVAGSIPNVPAFLAGHPLAMRRRIRAENEAAPLAITVDLGAAAQITQQDIQKRGAAILALVRVLSARRPVELWAGAILAAGPHPSQAPALDASATFCRIETAPLDIACAANILTHVSSLRRVVWAAASAHGYNGQFPFNAYQRHSDHQSELLAPAFAHTSEALHLPRLKSSDELSIKDPAKWIETQIERFAAGVDLAA